MNKFYSWLILWMMHTRDLTQNLNDIKLLSENSYEWLTILKYNFGKNLII